MIEFTDVKMSIKLYLVSFKKCCGARPIIGSILPAYSSTMPLLPVLVGTGVANLYKA